MYTIDRYITRQANLAILMVMAALVSLVSLFALFEEIEESNVAYGLKEAGTYVLQTMPRRFDEILVYGLFIGYLITLGRFAETNELTICRVAGMSPNLPKHRIVYDSAGLAVFCEPSDDGPRVVRFTIFLPEL